MAQRSRLCTSNDGANGCLLLGGRGRGSSRGSGGHISTIGRDQPQHGQVSKTPVAPQPHTSWLPPVVRVGVGGGQGVTACLQHDRHTAIEYLAMQEVTAIADAVYC